MEKEPNLDPIEQQALEFGVDIALIESNLHLTYEERMNQHQYALDLMLECEAAGRKFYERAKENS